MNRMAGAAPLALVVVALGVGAAFGWTQFVTPMLERRPVVVENREAAAAEDRLVGERLTEGEPMADALASTGHGESFDTSAHSVPQEAAIQAVQVATTATRPVPQLPAWTLSASPSLTLGVADGTPEELFHNLSGAVQLTDGSIAVVDGGRSVVGFFDGRGGHLRTVGGAGDGPEELRFPRLLPAAAYDSLLVVSGDSRISVVGPDGEVAVAGSFAVADLPRVVIPEGMVHLRFPHVDVNRGLAASSGLRPADPELVMVDPLSGARTVLEHYRYTTDYIVVSDRGQFNVPLPLRAGLSVAPMPGGDLAVVVANAGVLRILRPSTGTSSSIPLPIPPVEVTRADVQRITAERLERASAQDPLVATVIRELPFPDEFPFVESLVPDETGGVWARLHPEHAGRLGGDWLALSSSGEGRALIRMPDGFELFQVGADFVIGTSRDELGIQRVHRYDLYRTAR